MGERRPEDKSSGMPPSPVARRERVEEEEGELPRRSQLVGDLSERTES